MPLQKLELVWDEGKKKTPCLTQENPDWVWCRLEEATRSFAVRVQEQFDVLGNGTCFSSRFIRLDGLKDGCHAMF